MSLRGHDRRRIIDEIEASRTVFQAGDQVVFQVYVLHVHAFIHDGDDDRIPAHGELVPDFLDVDVGTGIPPVHKVPLAAEIWIVESARVDGDLRRYRHDAGNCGQVAGGTGGGNLLVKFDIVEAVKPFAAGAGLELAGVREYSPDGLDAHSFQCSTQLRRPRGKGIATPQGLFDEFGGLFIELDGDDTGDEG